MKKNKNWGRVFYFSFVIHLGVLFILIFTPIVRPKPKIIEFNLIPPMEMFPVPVPEAKVEEIIEKTSPLPKQPEVKPDTLVIPEKPKPKPKPRPKKKKVKPKKKIIKKKTVSPEVKKKILQRRLKAIENKFANTDTAMSGVSTTQHFPFQAYLIGLQQQITNAWDIPGHLALEKDLSAFVTFTIGRNGELLEINLKSSSTKEAFDQSALQAVRSAVPFAALPQDYKESSLEITIRFQLDE